MTDVPGNRDQCAVAGALHGMGTHSPCPSLDTNRPAMRTSFNNVATAVLTVCAVVVTALLVRRELQRPVMASAEPGVTEVASWRDFDSDRHRVGPADAAVVLIEFSDFQCPYCRMLAATIDSVSKKYPGKIAHVYRHYPLAQIHPHAMDAALASECAAVQGKFTAYHDLLFQQQDSIGVTSWVRFAMKAGVPDTTEFQSCVAERRTVASVQEDISAGERLGISGTPRLLVNEHSIPGAPAFETLDRLISERLR